MSKLRLAALIALTAAPAAGAVIFGQQRGVTGKVAVGKPSSSINVAKSEENVLDVPRTEETVHQLNGVRLERHRCHSVTSDAPPAVDPFQLVAAHLEPLGHVVRGELDAESATLRDSAQHFFGKGRAREGKRVRPVLVLLVGATTALNAPASAQPVDAETAFTKRKQLAAITEMIHTASLIHDDVLDAADTRRGDAAVHRLYSTKAAVLSGDFLLARASVMLARMGNAQVVREMSKSLEALVQGELMQLKSSAEERLSLE